MFPIRGLASVLLVAVISCATAHRHFSPPCVTDRSCTAPEVIADSSLPRGELRGLVVGRPDMCRLGRAQIQTVATGREALASKEGEFRLTGLLVGVDTVVVRFIGYRRARVSVTVPKSGGLWLLIPMDPEAISLSDGGTLLPCRLTSA